MCAFFNITKEKKSRANFECFIIYSMKTDAIILELKMTPFKIPIRNISQYLILSFTLDCIYAININKKRITNNSKRINEIINTLKTSCEVPKNQNTIDNLLDLLVIELKEKSTLYTKHENLKESLNGKLAKLEKFKKPIIQVSEVIQLIKNQYIISTNKNEKDL